MILKLVEWIISSYPLNFKTENLYMLYFLVLIPIYKIFLSLPYLLVSIKKFFTSFKELRL